MVSNTADPRTPSARTSSPNEERPSYRAPPRTGQPSLEVLVVDDDDSVRELGEAIVTRLGHQCRTAGDGIEALRLLAEKPADVIVSDWDMPGMDGIELCRRTRTGGDEVPYTYFIIVTGFTGRERVLAGMEAGADDYQRKPLNVHELEARLMSAGRVVGLHRRLAAQTAELRGTSAALLVESRTDAMTGTGNRLSLDEDVTTLMARAARYGNKCSLAICDLDFFKAYNDHFGHIAGDQALCRVAEGMRSTLRNVDTLYRYGGEEFVVLLVEQSIEAATRAMDRMRDAIERLAIDSPATGGPLTLSVGIAEFDPSLDKTPGDWIRRADEALYEAKSAGRNRVMSTLPPRG